MGVSWEEMCQQVVIDGRPGDVASAALGWTELLKNLRSVKESLEKNTTDLGAVWKGPAFDSFKTHVDEIAKTTGRLIDDAEEGDGIVHSLNAAADRLTEAQREFPIPASCVNDVLEARNGHLTIGVGFFEAKVAPDFLGLLDPIAGLADWLNDRTDEAAQVYNQVNNQYQGQAATMPGESSNLPTQRNPDLDTPDLNTGGAGGGAGSVPSLPGGGGPGTTGTPDLPSTGNPDLLSTPDQNPPDIDRNPPDVDTTPPDLGGTPTGPDGLDDEQYGSGLASAAPPSGAGPNGLPSTSGLGGGGGPGGGAGPGSVPGGGALGRPVATMVPPMMGGGAAGAGRGGGGRGAGGRLGGAPGMLGGAAGGAGGRGAGGGGRGAGATAAGARGAAGGRGGLAGAGATGAGYGEDEANRTTWLDEDEDVWGADGDSMPGVLR